MNSIHFQSEIILHYVKEPLRSSLSFHKNVFSLGIAVKSIMIARQRPSKENITLGYYLNTNIYGRLMCLRIADNVILEYFHLKVSRLLALHFCLFRCTMNNEKFSIKLQFLAFKLRIFKINVSQRFAIIIRRIHDYSVLKIEGDFFFSKGENFYASGRSSMEEIIPKIRNKSIYFKNFKLRI